jgi:hypothetical protein
MAIGRILDLGDKISAGGNIWGRFEKIKKRILMHSMSIQSYIRTSFYRSQIGQCSLYIHTYIHVKMYVCMYCISMYTRVVHIIHV